MEILLPNYVRACKGGGVNCLSNPPPPSLEFERRRKVGKKVEMSKTSKTTKAFLSLKIAGNES